jgi:DNA-binding transcriptional ArsR family regulator
MKMTQAVATLTALGHAKRLAVFRHLVEAGPEGRMAGDLAAALDMPGATLSFHLKELSNAALIEAEPRGRYICYRANYVSMNALIAFLTENCCGGRGCVNPTVLKSPARRRRSG